MRSIPALFESLIQVIARWRKRRFMPLVASEIRRPADALAVGQGSDGEGGLWVSAGGGALRRVFGIAPRVQGGVIFVFVDQNGLGEYSLVHSTYRTEIREDNWYRQYALKAR